jgi:hypothetical protein
MIFDVIKSLHDGQYASRIKGMKDLQEYVLDLLVKMVGPRNGSRCGLADILHQQPD